MSSAAVRIRDPPAPSLMHGAPRVPPCRGRFGDPHVALYHLSGHLERPAPRVMPIFPVLTRLVM